MKPQALSTHKNIFGNVEFLFVEFCFLKPDCDIFGTKTSHKQLFLKGGKRKLPTQKINAVDYSESNAGAMERKWEKQIASNVNIILPLKYSFCPHAHTLYLTKTMNKAAGTGRWLPRRKMNDFHVSYRFHFPTRAIFL